MGMKEKFVVSAWFEPLFLFVIGGFFVSSGFANSVHLKLKVYEEEVRTPTHVGIRLFCDIERPKASTLQCSSVSWTRSVVTADDVSDRVTESGETGAENFTVEAYTVRAKVSVHMYAELAINASQAETVLAEEHLKGIYSCSVTCGSRAYTIACAVLQFSHRGRSFLCSEKSFTDVSAADLEHSTKNPQGDNNNNTTTNNTNVYANKQDNEVKSHTTPVSSQESQSLNDGQSSLESDENNGEDSSQDSDQRSDGKSSSESDELHTEETDQLSDGKSSQDSDQLNTEESSEDSDELHAKRSSQESNELDAGQTSQDSDELNADTHSQEIHDLKTGENSQESYPQNVGYRILETHGNHSIRNNSEDGHNDQGSNDTVYVSQDEADLNVGRITNISPAKKSGDIVIQPQTAPRVVVGLVIIVSCFLCMSGVLLYRCYSKYRRAHKKLVSRAEGELEREEEPQEREDNVDDSEGEELYDSSEETDSGEESDEEERSERSEQTDSGEEQVPDRTEREERELHPGADSHQPARDSTREQRQRPRRPSEQDRLLHRENNRHRHRHHHHHSHRHSDRTPDQADSDERSQPNTLSVFSISRLFSRSQPSSAPDSRRPHRSPIFLGGHRAVPTDQQGSCRHFSGCRYDLLQGRRPGEGAAGRAVWCAGSDDTVVIFLPDIGEMTAAKLPSYDDAMAQAQQQTCRRHGQGSRDADHSSGSQQRANLLVENDGEEAVGSREEENHSPAHPRRFRSPSMPPPPYPTCEAASHEGVCSGVSPNESDFAVSLSSPCGDVTSLSRPPSYHSVNGPLGESTGVQACEEPS